ncbi:hypothetical protein CBS147333_9396 [Penicillium roqueforti]|nr:hypothetical protein CBS147333_9396 [Penicillium roqueforti]KAI3191007.1 hypothetical protein CBS147311_9596 [Penicillium roqueforti]KAI3261157.1 hypothetical protein CBS147308_9988 [Penicillium roqueforti]KAI3277828.1 hypothetical protein DTO003C3_10066 [Penicillium roqueforti]
MTAARYGSESTLKLFLKNSKTIINLRNAAGKSALWYSVEKGSYSIVKKLLRRPDIEIDLLDHEGQTALWLAIFQKNEKLVRLLLSKGADPYTKDRDGVSPWMAAFNRAPMVDVILEHFETLRPESKSKICSSMPETIHGAASKGDSGVLRKLLRRGGDVNAVDGQRRTALHLAASNGHREAAELLLSQKSIDLAALDQTNGTPLHAAAMGGHLAVVDLLLHQNAPVNCKDNYRNTPLWYSTSSHRDDVTERLLTENDVDINTVGGGGRYDEPSTSLYHLARRMDTVVLRWFLARPTLDPNICVGCRSPLRLAITEGNIAVVRLLLTHKELEINARHTHEDSPLCLATERGDVNAVKVLVEQGGRLKINQLNSIDEESALCVAVRNQSLNILDILLQHPDINLNLTNRWGETALGLPVKAGDVKIVKRLLQDSKRVSNLEVPALLAKSRKNDVVEELIKDEIKRKRRDTCYPSQDRLFTRHVRYAYI